MSGNCKPEEIESLENFYNDFHLHDPVWTSEMGDREKIYTELLLKLRYQLRPSKNYIKHISFVRWAAVVFLISFGAILYYYVQVNTIQDRISVLKFETKKGEKKQVTLKDGTLVWLNSESTLEVSKDFNESDRKVNLVGEAYFDVKYEKAKPFKVHTVDFDINVLGTLFNIKAYPGEEKAEATLVRGRISMVPAKDPKHLITLNPSEKVILFKDRENVLDNKEKDAILPRVSIDHYKQTPDSSVIETAWIQSRLEIQDQNFKDLKVVLERWFDVEIDLQSKYIENYRFTGTYTNENIVSVLQSMQKVQPFKFRIDGKKITIYK